MEQRPEDDAQSASRRFAGANVLVFIGVGLCAMGGFLLVQQLTGGPMVWDKSHGVYWTRSEAIALALGMVLEGGAMWRQGARMTLR